MGRSVENLKATRASLDSRVQSLLGRIAKTDALIMKAEALQAERDKKASFLPPREHGRWPTWNEVEFVFPEVMCDMVDGDRRTCLRAYVPAGEEDCFDELGIRWHRMHNSAYVEASDPQRLFEHLWFEANDSVLSEGDREYLEGEPYEVCYPL